MMLEPDLKDGRPAMPGPAPRVTEASNRTRQIPPLRPGMRWSRLHLPLGLLALLLSLMPLEPADAVGPRSAITASMVIKVVDRDQTADALVKQTEVLEGYFARRTDDSITLKVPVEQSKALLTFAEGLGSVVERNYEAQDLGTQLDQQRARLSSRESMLDKYFDVIKGAGASGVLTVEQETTGLVEEIEKLRGAIRLMEHRLQFAEVTINFQFRDRAAPVKDGRSSFPWLNSLNLVDLVEDFRRVGR